jgi:hypothetical protein
MPTMQPRRSISASARGGAAVTVAGMVFAFVVGTRLVNVNDRPPDGSPLASRSTAGGR